MLPVIVTASQRDPSVQRRCYDSILRAGFSDLLISAEPLADRSYSDARYFVNLTQRGQFENMIQAIQLGIASGAELFVTAEDDVLFCRDVAETIERLPLPSPRCGLVQLYTSEGYRFQPGSTLETAYRYPRMQRSLLHIEQSLDMLGACALLWRRDAAVRVVEEAATRGWRGCSYGNVFDPVLKRDGDTFIGEAMCDAKLEIWIHRPSLAEHIGDVSTLGHNTVTPRRKAWDFPGEHSSAFDCVSMELEHA